MKRLLGHRRSARVAFVVLITLILIAAGADLLAAELPLAIRIDGSTHLLPVWTRPAALRHQTQRTLKPKAEWMVPTPIPFGPNETFIGNAAAQHNGPLPWGPGAEHWLGTDDLGRDVLARLIHGAQVSLTVGFLSVLICVLLGLTLGCLAGYFGGRVDAVISRLIEIMMTFPTLFFVLAVLGLLRISSLVPLVAVIGLTRWTDIARLVRAEALRLRSLDFVTASRALGASHTRVLFKHVLPNAIDPVLVAATFGVASAVLLESALSFLGLGAPPPTSSWGEMLTQGHQYLTHPGAWWLSLFPGLCLTLTVLCLNAVGEGLKAGLDRRA